MKKNKKQVKKSLKKAKVPRVKKKKNSIKSKKKTKLSRAKKKKVKVVKKKRKPLKKTRHKAKAKKQKPRQKKKSKVSSAGVTPKQIQELVTKGKEKGYLTYDQINEILPEDITSSEQIDSILNVLDEKKIELLDAQAAAARDAQEKQAVSSQSSSHETSSSVDDPVRMYLRQMGQIPLLSREDEVSLAKRIEAAEMGFREVIFDSKLARGYVMELADKIVNEEVNTEEFIKDDLGPGKSRMPARLAKLRNKLKRTKKQSAVKDILFKFNLATPFAEEMGVKIKIHAEQIERINREITRLKKQRKWSKIASLKKNIRKIMWSA